MKKPLIGVTGPDHGGFTAWNFTRMMLFFAEARAVRITPSHPFDVAKLDGLIIGGGSDIDPRLYGARRHPKTVHIDRKRDKMEWKMIEEAYRRKIPLMGICRGMQMLNVFFKGTLNQHIFDLDLSSLHQRSVFPYKVIYIRPHTLLYNIWHIRKTEVNSLHHQAIEKLGRGLRIGAWDENGIVQEIEHIDYPFLLGVQWHPEYMPQSYLQRKLFGAFVKAAAKAAALV